MKSENNERNNTSQQPEKPQGLSPLWFLAGMGVLIALVLAAELLGLKK